MEHSTQYNYLQKQLKSGKISHAYVFIGPENTNKLEIAEQLTADLFCKCGKCQICRQIKKKIYPEILYIIPEKEQILIEQIRRIKHFLAKKSISWQVVIIKQAHLLNKQSANALLKTLEEPGNKQVIILLADKLNTLPKTIASRCQIINFLPAVFKPDIEKKEFKQWLDFFKSKENKITALEKFLNKKTQAQMNQIIDWWIIVWREILLSGQGNYSTKQARDVLDKLLQIKKKGNNLNLKLQLENIIINL
jgi:DNA polymerase III delta prime subunit